MEPHLVVNLIIKKLENTIDPEEELVLNQWMNASDDNRSLVTSFTDPKQREKGVAGHWVYEDVWEMIETQISENDRETVTARVHFLKTAWFRFASSRIALQWATAAAILIIVGIGSYLWIPTQEENRNLNVLKPSPANDIAPGQQKAILTLADGSTIILDSVANGQLAVQGNLQIIKRADGEIYYEGSQPIPSGVLPEATPGGAAPGGASSNINPSGPGAGVGSHFGKNRRGTSYNTMSTPRGGQYQLTLSDGTKVWLNAESSITYPTAFAEQTRQVTVTGEAYFEVARDRSKPFLVKTYSETIEVLGTTFNINAYGDELYTKTTLVEGAVRINNKILKPGEAFSNGKIVATNMQQDIAWKNGVFDFNQKGITDVARQIARWYDIQIVFDGPVTDVKLYGKADRKLSLKGLLKGLEGEIAHFSLEGKKLHIKAL